MCPPGADPETEFRGGYEEHVVRVYNGALWTVPPAESRVRAPDRTVKERKP